MWLREKGKRQKVAVCTTRRTRTSPRALSALTAETPATAVSFTQSPRVHPAIILPVPSVVVEHAENIDYCIASIQTAHTRIYPMIIT